VADRFPEELNIFGLGVNSNTALLEQQVKRHRPQVVCVRDPKAAEAFAPKVKAVGTELLVGDQGLEALAGHDDADIVLNAVVGFAGLRSTLAAARAGKRIALANKESMVAGGDLVNKTIFESKAEIIPVDSEHSAIFQCLKAGRQADIKRLILTASGGPFRQYPLEKFSSITTEQALKHPTWNMGKKITIDSATLMNKGLEIIEAVYLFGLAPEKIGVVIHPQSIVHSMVEYSDGAIIAQLSRPDMRLPIEYALFYPERRPLGIADLPFDKTFSLEFEPPENAKFPSLDLARRALLMGAGAPAVFNSANEVAVQAFLEHRISFSDIFSAVDYSLQNAENPASDSFDSVITADKMGRDLAWHYVRSKGGQRG
jgi:1-deoxy-D-xylulose-5-phosphate reductoisomerase